MFDFFDEVIEFLNQVVDMINWFFSFIWSVLTTAGTSVGHISDMASGFPAPFAALILLSLGALIFEFIRGR